MSPPLITTVATVLLAVGAVVFVILPILRGRQASLFRAPDELGDNEARKKAALFALRDVEYDYVMGKLDEGDYRRLKGEIAQEALSALEESRVADGEAAAIADPWMPFGLPEIERQVATLRQGLRERRVCLGCGYLNEGGSRFCAQCGKLLSE